MPSKKYYFEGYGHHDGKGSKKIKRAKDPATAKVKAGAEKWDMRMFTKEEADVLPQTQEEFDAIVAVILTSMAQRYHFKQIDLEGLHSLCMYYAWAYWMLTSREVPMASINGVKLARSMLDRETIERMAKAFREKVNDCIEEGVVSKDFSNDLKEMYGYKDE